MGASPLVVLYPEKLTYGWTSFRGAGQVDFGCRTFIKKSFTKIESDPLFSIAISPIELSDIISRGRSLGGELLVLGACASDGSSILGNKGLILFITVSAISRKKL
jgi:hypothetical protein